VSCNSDSYCEHTKQGYLKSVVFFITRKQRRLKTYGDTKVNTSEKLTEFNVAKLVQFINSNIDWR
jgi:hypothetical protein